MSVRMFSWLPWLSVCDHSTSKRPKQKKTCHILAEWLLVNNVPPAVSMQRFAQCSHAGRHAAVYNLTDKNWKNMGAIRCRDSGDPPFLCLPNMVPARIYILHVLIWIKCSLISIISIISDRVTLIFPLDEKWSFYSFAFSFFFSFFPAERRSYGCAGMHFRCKECVISP